MGSAYGNKGKKEGETEEQKKKRGKIGRKKKEMRKEIRKSNIEKIEEI